MSKNFKIFLLAILTVFSIVLATFAIDFDSLKLVQMSDIHLSHKEGNSGSRLYKHSYQLFEAAVKQTNAIKGVDAVVFSGDYSNRARVDDLEAFAEIANKLNEPWYMAPGNHDIGVCGGLSKKKFMEVLTKANKYLPSSNIYYAVVPKPGYLLVFLDGTTDKIITATGYFPTEQLNWLDKTLSEHSNKKVIIVQHFPLYPPFSSMTHFVINKQEYLDVINKHNNVIAILSGHYHGTKVTVVNNVAHISTPSGVQYPNAFRLLTFKDNGDKIQISSKMYETSLKNLQNLSKKSSRSPSTHYGKESDRNFTIELKNNVK